MHFNTWAIEQLYILLIIFSRIFGVFIFVPGIGERFISNRIKITLAFLLALLLTPVLNLFFNVTIPQSSLLFFLKIGAEIMIGCYFGLTLKIVVSTINMMGFVISSATGLSAANIFDPLQASQGSIVGNFLSITFLVLLFSFNLDHDLIKLIATSYDKFPLWSFFDSINDIAQLFIDTVQSSWFLAIKLSLSFLIISFIINVSAGLISRLMPQMNVFFVVMPVQILIGFFVMMLSLSSILLLFINEYKSYIYNFLG